MTLCVPFNILNDLTDKDGIDIVQECENGIFGRLIQHQHEIKFSFNTPTFRHSASSGCSKQ